MIPSPSELLRDLRDTVESPLSSREDIRRALGKLETVSLFRRAIKQDPIVEAIDSVLMEVNGDVTGVAMLAGQPLTVKSLATAIGHNYLDHGVVTRIGKRMSLLGYARIAPTRHAPARWRVPKVIG